MKIRITSDPADRQRISEFVFSCHLASSARTPEEEAAQTADLPDDFPELYSDEIFRKAQYWMVEEAEKVVAVLGMRPDPQDTSLVWISYLGVSKHLRKQGLAKKFMDMGIEWSKKSGFNSIQLVTLPGVLDTAVGIYKKYGFVDTEVKVTPHYNVTTMELKLLTN